MQEQDREAQAAAWLVRLHSGQATAEDAEACRRWCAADVRNRQALSRLRQHWSNLSRLPLPEPDSAARRRVLIGLGSGALAAGLAACVVWLPERQGAGGQRWMTAVGEQRQVTLAGAQLHLNTDTQVRARHDQPGVMTLEQGEVELMASADAVLSVTCGRGRLRFSQARVNLRREVGRDRVTCLEGSLTLFHPAGERQLRGGEQLAFDARRISQPHAADLSGISAWRQGELVFEHARLEQVIDELNRYRRGRVVLMRKELSAQPVQARFRIDQVELVPEMLATTYGLELVRLPGGILLLT